MPLTSYMRRRIINFSNTHDYLDMIQGGAWVKSGATIKRMSMRKLEFADPHRVVGHKLTVEGSPPLLCI